MDIVNHPLCDRTIGAPPDMQEPHCSALPCTEVTDEFGTWTVSVWKPSFAELEVLNANGHILMCVRATGNDHPVVGLDVI